MCSGWFQGEHFLTVNSLKTVDAGDWFVGKELTKISGGRTKFRALRICARQARSRFLARVTREGR
jgi:hypothetical protein